MRRSLVVIVLSIVMITTMSLAAAPMASAATYFRNPPCKVYGFSLHARFRMATRDISEAEVKRTVSENCSQAWIEDTSVGLADRTFYYPGHPAVVLNSQGVVVTTMWVGGGGSWRIAV